MSSKQLQYPNQTAFLNRTEPNSFQTELQITDTHVVTVFHLRQTVGNTNTTEQTARWIWRWTDNRRI